MNFIISSSSSADGPLLKCNKTPTSCVHAMVLTMLAMVSGLSLYINLFPIIRFSNYILIRKTNNSLAKIFTTRERAQTENNNNITHLYIILCTLNKRRFCTFIYSFVLLLSGFNHLNAISVNIL